MSPVFRAVVAAIALLASARAAASDLVQVPDGEAYCAETIDWGAFCREWKLAHDPRVRLVAFGYEDGVSYTFYRRTRFGRYRDALRVTPVFAANAHPGQFFDADASQLHALAGEAAAVQADRGYVYGEVPEGEASTPDGQKRIPNVLFTGAPSDADVELRPLTLGTTSLRELRRRSRLPVDEKP